jgi:hypothetical protein
MRLKFENQMDLRVNGREAIGKDRVEHPESIWFPVAVTFA